MTFKKLLAVLLVLVAVPAQAALEITVTGGDVAPLPIALVQFQPTPEVPLDVAQVVENDLVRSGRFKALPRGAMPQTPTAPQAVVTDGWKAAGIDNLVIGQLGKSADGYYARFFLIDTVSGQQLLSHQFSVKSPAQMRTVAHMIADMIYEKLLGIPGYFNTKIAYVAASGYGPARNFQLVVSDSDGEAPRVLATSREPILSPAWAPDRKQLAFVGYNRGRSAVMVYTLATGQVRTLVSEPGLNSSPAWSPDGSKIAVSLSFENNPDIYVIDVASNKRRRLTDHYGIDTEPAWSPDGSKIVFTSDRGGRPQIYEMGAEGGDPRRVTFQGGQNLRASYSPDGKSLALVNADGGRFRIGLLDLASGGLKLLSDGPQDEGPQFAPGGAVVIYATQGRAGGAELATVSVDGRVRTRLRQAADIKEPAWSPVVR
ncbi:Tol-Pal system beta propeller repeat protein TolB [Solimonas sp. SE-A11]|uniref:Tol-Pal system beta propeller repeat protein TolB n=1 Tax=Solimonas sp. SE-A11 TaxID=3054954 RepID=UPI00259C8E72|nr:Tol-Pal system beta propeller repeat protein TolB [Solimonas sp. SE-A11]MDM4771717.1 Tol-Pal system beta propeller repeat protein TolB [Solimonas sp. SE-A11]